MKILLCIICIIKINLLSTIMIFILDKFFELIGEVREYLIDRGLDKYNYRIQVSYDSSNRIIQVLFKPYWYGNIVNISRISKLSRRIIMRTQPYIINEYNKIHYINTKTSDIICAYTFDEYI